MAHDLTESSTFAATVQVPDDGDFVNEASIETGMQALANRTKFLKDASDARAVGAASSTDNHVARFDGTTGKIIQDGSPVTISDAGAVTGVTTIVTSGDITAGDDMIATGDFEYATPKSRTTFIPAFHRIGTVGNLNGYGDVTIATNSGILFFDVSSWLPDGAIVTAISTMIDPGAVRAGVNRTRMLIERSIRDIVTPGTGSQPGVADVYDAGTSALQLIPSGVIAVTIAKASGECLQVRVYGGNDASSNNDTVYGLKVEWTDAGPRND